jgi:hypothetical protein
MTGDVSNDLVYDLREAAYGFGWQDAKLGKKEQPPRELRVLALERQVREMLNERDAEVARLRAALLRLADVSRRFVYPDDGDGVTDEAFCAELDAAQKLASE